jgi:hypothetical protein
LQLVEHSGSFVLVKVVKCHFCSSAFATICALRFLNARRGPFCVTFWFVLHLLVADNGPALFMFVDDEEEEDVMGDEHMD